MFLSGNLDISMKIRVGNGRDSYPYICRMRQYSGCFVFKYVMGSLLLIWFACARARLNVMFFARISA